jgi:hypothetical protein
MRGDRNDPNAKAVATAVQNRVISLLENLHGWVINPTHGDTR